MPLDIHRDGAPDCPLVLDRSIEIIANNRFSCPYSKDCLEKYSTVQSLKKHAIEFHHNLTKKARPSTVEGSEKWQLTITKNYT